MLTDDALSWWRETGGVISSYDGVQPYGILLAGPSGEDEVPWPLLIGPFSLHAEKLGNVNPLDYADQLAGPWRPYAIETMVKLRRISESGEPEFGISTFPSELPGVAGFRYEWVTLPCRLTHARVLVTAAGQIAIH